ncbi:MAG: glycosyltransferase [Clostridia bacterium]|nr:glycosyltransferase [Clostridia bacterium]
MENVKVLHILTVRYGKNGVTRCAMNYIERFRATRADLALGFPLPEDAARAFQARGARAVALPSRLRRPLAYFCALKRLIRQEGYPLVEVHGNSCTMALELLAARRAGAVVRAPHAHNTRCSFRLLHRLLRPAFDRNRTAAFACGREAGAWLYRGAPFTVVPNAIDAAAFAFRQDARARARAALGLEGGFVLGHVGGFVEQKNHVFLLEIFRALRAIRPNAMLLLAGSGPLRGEIERRAEAGGLSEALRFVAGSDDMPALYAAMDAFVLPSLFEGLPFTLVEAQAAGLRCCASDAVTREAGMGGLVRFMPPDAPAAAWAEAILAGDTAEDRGRLSAEAAAGIEAAGYSIAECAAAHEALYRRLLAEARPCG